MADSEKPPSIPSGDLVDQMCRARDAGRAEFFSGRIADLLRQGDDWRDSRAALDRIFAHCPDPGPQHFAWARRALGVGPKPAA